MNSNPLILLINSHVACSNVANNGYSANLPIWLSAGNYLVKVANGSLINVIASISAIEFNITP